MSCVHKIDIEIHVIFVINNWSPVVSVMRELFKHQMAKRSSSQLRSQFNCHCGDMQLKGCQPVSLSEIKVFVFWGLN